MKLIAHADVALGMNKKQRMICSDIEKTVRPGRATFISAFFFVVTKIMSGPVSQVIVPVRVSPPDG